jgi:tRNA pseudouridine38-40 synthase
MPRYLFTFEFDGTAFKGWQKQPGERTVEGVAEEALSTLYQLPADLIGQGRTDAGVHARNQTAHVDLPDRYPSSRVLHAMRGLLPKDVALKEMTEVSPDFHARFHALSRSYSYSVITRPSPLRRTQSWFRYGDIDPGVLHRCAGQITGSHDFINFCIPPEVDEMTTICEITESRWEERSDDEWVYRIEGNRFLRHMVRRLVGTMIKTAAGKVPEEEFHALLHGPARSEKGFAAPSRGLTLEKVTYPE